MRPQGSTVLRRDLGRCAARLARGLSDFSHGGANHKLLWDLQHAAELRPLIDAVRAERRGLVEDVLGGFRSPRPADTSAVAEPARSITTSTRITSSSTPKPTPSLPGSSISATSPARRGSTTSAITAAYQVADDDDP
jgi:hypothetical protein